MVTEAIGSPTPCPPVPVPRGLGQGRCAGVSPVKLAKAL